MVTKKTRNILLWIGGGALFLMVFGIVAVPDIPILPDVVSGISGLFSGGVAGLSAVSPTVPSVTEGRQLVSDSILLKAEEMYSKNYDNTKGGNILVYKKGTNPADPSASSLATLKLGTAYTTSDLLTNTVYRVVYSNSTTAYAHDFGDIVLMSDAEYNDQTADVAVDLTDKFGFRRQEVATLSDFFDETSTDGRMNGQTTNATVNIIGGGTAEIGCNNAATACTADDVMTYNETNGDGSVYLDVKFAATGSNSALKDAVVCFEFESGAEPEGNEISSIVVQHLSGTVFNFPAGTNWANVWAQQECVLATSEMLAGTIGEYRFTFTITESNYDTSDDFKMYFDDLGKYQGKDALLNLGATAESVDFDNVG